MLSQVIKETIDKENKHPRLQCVHEKSDRNRWASHGQFSEAFQEDSGGTVGQKSRRRGSLGH